MSYKCNTTEYIKIHISDLIFDGRSAEMVRENGGIFPESLKENIYNKNMAKLTQKRLDSVLKGYIIGLPPILVVKTVGGKYHVLNGRHRVAATILNGDEYLPAIVDTE